MRKAFQTSAWAAWQQLPGQHPQSHPAFNGGHRVSQIVSRIKAKKPRIVKGGLIGAGPLRQPPPSSSQQPVRLPEPWLNPGG